MHARRRPAAGAAHLLRAPAERGCEREIHDAQWKGRAGPPHLPPCVRLIAAWEQPATGEHVYLGLCTCVHTVVVCI